MVEEINKYKNSKMEYFKGLNPILSRDTRNEVPRLYPVIDFIFLKQNICSLDDVLDNLHEENICRPLIEYQLIRELGFGIKQIRNKFNEKNDNNISKGDFITNNENYLKFLLENDYCGRVIDELVWEKEHNIRLDISSLSIVDYQPLVAKETRKMVGFTQKELADHLNLSLRRILAWENEGRVPSKYRSLNFLNYKKWLLKNDYLNNLEIFRSGDHPLFYNILPDYNPLIAREIRKKVGFTQKELADHLNLSLRTIGGWENGERVPGNNPNSKRYRYTEVKYIGWLFKNGYKENLDNNKDK